MGGSRGGGGQGVQTLPLPLDNYKAIGFLSNNGLDPLKNNKATKPVLKGVRALRDYFGPLWSQNLKVPFHQFLLVGLLEE